MLSSRHLYISSQNNNSSYAKYREKPSAAATECFQAALAGVSFHLNCRISLQGLLSTSSAAHFSHLHLLTCEMCRKVSKGGLQIKDETIQ